MVNSGAKQAQIRQPKSQRPTLPYIYQPHLGTPTGASLCPEIEGCCCLDSRYLPAQLPTDPTQSQGGEGMFTGEMVITRIPMGARSRAMGSVMATMPLEAEHAAVQPGEGVEVIVCRPQQVRLWACLSHSHLAPQRQPCCLADDDPNAGLLVWFVLAHLTSHQKCRSH